MQKVNKCISGVRDWEFLGLARFFGHQDNACTDVVYYQGCASTAYKQNGGPDFGTVRSATVKRRSRDKYGPN